MRKPTTHQSSVIELLRLGHVTPEPHAPRAAVAHYEANPAAAVWVVARTLSGANLTEMWRVHPDGRAEQF